MMQYVNIKLIVALLLKIFTIADRRRKDYNFYIHNSHLQLRQATVLTQPQEHQINQKPDLPDLREIFLVFLVCVCAAD